MLVAHLRSDALPGGRAGHQGGDVSEEQLVDNAQAAGSTVDDDVNANKRVSGQETGAKRGSFFKDRDYPA